jgi:hypothetical protein
VAQGVGPEFNPQYHTKKKERGERERKRERERERKLVKVVNFVVNAFYYSFKFFN